MAVSRVPQDAIDEITADLRALPGIRAAPEEPPDSINAFPFIVVYDGGGGIWSSYTPSAKQWLGSIVVELHVGRKDLPHDFQNAQIWSEVIPNALLKQVATSSGDRFNSTVDAIGNITVSVFGALGWGDIDTFGYRWTINNVKIQSTIT
jgi:hypothetical protein